MSHPAGHEVSAQDLGVIEKDPALWLCHPHDCGMITSYKITIIYLSSYLNL